MQNEASIEVDRPIDEVFRLTIGRGLSASSDRRYCRHRSGCFRSDQSGRWAAIEDSDCGHRNDFTCNFRLASFPNFPLHAAGFDPGDRVET